MFYNWTMRTIDTRQIGDCVYRLALRAGTRMTDPCRAALENARLKERGAAQYALSTVLENARIAQRECLPVCQDTGMSAVLLEVGQDVHFTGMLLGDAVNEGVRRAYRDGYFRKSICDPLSRENTGDNTPAYVHIDIVEGDHVRITYLPKGFGSENMSRIFMLTPAQGKAGIVDAITETVRLAGARPCPPVVVGVGIGGCFDSCAFLAKKALTRDVGSAHPRKEVREIEQEALEKINSLGIGPQGFGGNVTALSVQCEVAPTHIAGLPVAVNIQCHCVRCEEEVL